MVLHSRFMISSNNIIKNMGFFYCYHIIAVMDSMDKKLRELKNTFPKWKILITSRSPSPLKYPLKAFI